MKRAISDVIRSDYQPLNAWTFHVVMFPEGGESGYFGDLADAVELAVEAYPSLPNDLSHVYPGTD